jgi:hypothetical protein
MVFMLALLTTSNLTSIGQDLDNEWFRGKLYLANGETVEGLLQYDLDKDYLIIKKANRVKAYNAQQVEYFDYVDHVQNRLRSFYSLVYKAKHRKKHMFFELLKMGELSLLSREAWFVDSRPFTRSFYFPGRYTSDLVLKEAYYILDKNQHIQPFNGVKSQLLDLMQDNYEAMDKYIRSEKLQMDRRADLLKIFYYYDNLKELQASETDHEQY